MNPILDKILRTAMVDDGAEQIPLHSNMSVAEGNLITDAFRFAKAKTSIEVGCAYGISALYACDSLAANNPGGDMRHILVDPFQSTQWRGIGLKNLVAAGFGPAVTLLEEPSEYALPRLAASGLQVDAAIIDGWHTLDHTLIDFFYVNRMLRVGGVLVVDDSHFPAINKLLRYILGYPAYRLGASAGVPTDLAEITSRLVQSEMSSPFGEQRPDWKAMPAGVLGTATTLIKVGLDERDWNWYRDF